METDEKPKTRKVKKQVRKGELPVSAGTASLDQQTKDKLSEQELSMISEDKLVADTEEKKNELETYIYELRNKIDDQYADFASDSEKTKLKEKLEAAEVSTLVLGTNHALTKTQDWLYDEGEDTTKAIYIAKQDEIRAIAGPIVQRYFDKVEEERAAAQAILDAELAKKRELAEAARQSALAQENAGKEQPASKDEEMTDVETKTQETEEEKK